MDFAAMTLAVSLGAFGNSALVALGIGLVIFVHEFGHYLCARRAGVRVEIFSLGFGPRLFGWVRKGTDYRISLVPVGGYVKVAGDVPGDGTGASDELLSKGVGARALFYSGGVLMNLAFGLIAFPIVFSIGVPMLAPALGGVTPGGPAWKAGLREGDVVRSVNGHALLSFEDLILEVALGDAQRTTLVVDRDGRTLTVPVRPEYSEALGHFALQATQPTDYRIAVVADGPAARAGLRDGDRIVELNGEPASYDAQRHLDALGPVPLTLAVERDGERRTVVVEPELIEGDRYYLGILSRTNAVIGLRGPFAQDDGLLRTGDAIVSVDGKPIVTAEDVPRDRPAGPAVLEVERGGERVEVRLPAELAARLADDVALGPRLGPISGGIPIRVARDGAAARAGLRDGDRLLTLDGKPLMRWADILASMQENAGEAVELAVLGADDAQRVIRVEPVKAQLAGYGFELERSYVTRRFAPGEAFLAGTRSAWNLARQFYLTLRKMVAREVSTEKNLGGIVAISAVSYHYAQRGIPTLFYFLALLSVHLAFINILPIPLFDGSHLLFLLIEKVKGSPVNDRVLGYTQVLGLVLVLSLLIYVTYNDIQRLLS